MNSRQDMLTTPITAVVLAAGASSRMGAHKLLLPLAGRPLLAWAVAAACASRAPEALVILGRESEAAIAALPPGRYRVITNEDYERGQATSLALAVTHASAESCGIAVILGDEPFMTCSAIDRVLEVASQEPNRIVLGGAAGRTGHPVYLPRRMFADILALSGDTGARAIIAREREGALVAPLDDDLAQFDVDTPEDYQRAIALAYRLPRYPA